MPLVQLAAAGRVLESRYITALARLPTELAAGSWQAARRVCLQGVRWCVAWVGTRGQLAELVATRRWEQLAAGSHKGAG